MKPQGAANSFDPHGKLLVSSGPNSLTICVWFQCNILIFMEWVNLFDYYDDTSYSTITTYVIDTKV